MIRPCKVCEYKKECNNVHLGIRTGSKVRIHNNGKHYWTGSMDGLDGAIGKVVRTSEEKGWCTPVAYSVTFTSREDEPYDACVCELEEIE